MQLNTVLFVSSIVLKMINQPAAVLVIASVSQALFIVFARLLFLLMSPVTEDLVSKVLYDWNLLNLWWSVWVHSEAPLIIHCWVFQLEIRPDYVFPWVKLIQLHKCLFISPVSFSSNELIRVDGILGDLSDHDFCLGVFVALNYVVKLVTYLAQHEWSILRFLWDFDPEHRCIAC